MTLLVTYFTPFGGETTNASEQAVRLLPDEIGPWTVYKAQLPVVFGLAGERALALMKRIRPDAVLCVGQAGGRREVTPELAARNLRWGRIPDNDGNRPLGQRIDPKGQDALFATLPAEAMTQAIRAAGLPARLSCHAGYYVCNDLYYCLLNAPDSLRANTVFVHVPKAETLPPAQAARALEAAVSVLPS